MQLNKLHAFCVYKTLDCHYRSPKCGKEAWIRYKDAKAKDAKLGNYRTLLSYADFAYLYLSVVVCAYVKKLISADGNGMRDGHPSKEEV